MNKYGLVWYKEMNDKYTHKYTGDDVLLCNYRYVYIELKLGGYIPQWQVVDVPMDIRNCLKARHLDDFRRNVYHQIQKQTESECVLAYTKKGGLFQYLSKIGNRNSEPMRITCFNGGAYNFEFRHWKMIKKLRQDDVKRGIPLFDNEWCISDDGICFFVEVDYRTSEILWGCDIPDRGSMLRDAVKIQSIVNGMFKSIDSTCYFMDCTPKLKHIAPFKWPVVCSGLHLVFPNIIVKCEQAKQIVLKIRDTTNLDVDVSPYKSKYACLRPAYSRKLITCPQCSGFSDVHDSLSSSCSLCLGKGKVGSGFYTPRYIITNSGKITSYNGESTSIIPSKQCIFSTKFIRNTHPPSLSTTVCKKRSASSSLYVPKVIQPVLVMSSYQREVINTLLMKVCTQKEMTPGTKIKTKHRNRYVISSRMKFCPNIGREHTHNHAYFIINKREIARYCHATSCGSLASLKSKLSVSDRKVLFGSIS